MDVTTIVAWLDELGWQHEPVDEATLRIFRGADDADTFFLRLTDNWLLLAIVPAIERDAGLPDDISRRLLAVNRDMRLAKFGYDEDDDISLSAELPTESLDPSELREAIERMRRYAGHYRSYLTTSP